MKDSTKALIDRGKRHISTNYAPAEIVFDHGQGMYLYDTEGREYLDFVAGIAVNALGYNHPGHANALHEQVERLLHVSNMFYTAEQIDLMSQLCERSFAQKVFLCNSGAEANEAALKLARRYQFVTRNRSDKFTVLSMKQSFHGRTLAAITATGQPKYHQGFQPLVPGFIYGEFNDLKSIDLIDDHIAAVIVEPVQGEGGVIPATKEFLQALRHACDKYGALLIFDEVQTGIGRTGKLFAYQHYGVEPDIMTLAKGLGGGVPIGAMLATEQAMKGWERGSHASTFGGNPLACRSALSVLQIIDDKNLCDNALRMGQKLMQGLERLAKKYSEITAIRGMGLMIGIECGEYASTVVANARQLGLLVNTAGGNTVRLVPPLIVDDSGVTLALERLEHAFAPLS